MRRPQTPARLLLLLAVGWSGAAAQQAELLSESAGGILALEGETRLEVSGFTGDVRVRQGKAGELRYAARTHDQRDVEQPVALWAEGSVLRIEPVAGAVDQPIRLEVSVGPDLEPRIELSDSKLSLAGVHGVVRVAGERIELVGRMIAGSLDLELSESSVRVLSVSDGLSLEGRELDVRLEQISGELILDVEGGTVGLTTVHGEVEATLEAAVFTAHKVGGGITVDAEGGRVALTDCRAGARLRLSGAPLQMNTTAGEIHVETDAEVRFSDHDGTLTIRGGEGLIQGANAKGGALEVHARGADVRLEACGSTTTVRGEELKLQVIGGKGELTVGTAYSTILVENAENTVSVENDFGDIEVRGATTLVDVVSRDGTVRLEGLKGAVKAKVDGPELAVGWTNLTGQELSTLENERGDIRVDVPGNARVGIDAQSSHGRVETDIEELKVGDDGRRATGILSGGKRAAPYVKKPTIRALASGDVYVYFAGQN